MNKNMVELKIDFLRQMDTYLVKHGDYAVWEDWLFDFCKDAIFKAIAEDTEKWNCTCIMFGELTKEEED